MQSRAQTVEAVVFFADRGVAKEMFYAEFEALLDGVVASPQYAGRQLRAAYLSIDPRLLIRSVVCFLLDFDEKGFIDRGWNMPLRQLAEHAGHGPELGAGPIRLACRRQCPAPWRQQVDLWDPLDSELRQLREAIRRNNLGLLVESEGQSAMPSDHRPPAAPAGLSAAADGPLPGQPAARPERVPEPLQPRLEEHQREQIRRLEQQAAAREEHWRQQLAASHQALGEQQQLNGALQRRLVEQAKRHQQANEALRSQLAAERQARLALEEQRALRDAALADREREAQLQQQLLGARDRLAAPGAQVSLERLAELGMLFVVYHPGAGHISVALQDLPGYQADPTAFVASRCAVDAAHYRAWLAHYRQPFCPVRLADGARCGASLVRIEVPRAFVPGRSDRCARHAANDPPQSLD